MKPAQRTASEPPADRRTAEVHRALAVLRQAGVAVAVLSTAEAVAAVGITRATIWNWRDHICAPGAKPGGDRWIAAPRLRQFLEQHWHGRVPEGVTAALAFFDHSQSHLRLILPADVLDRTKTRQPESEHGPARRRAR